MVRASDLLTTFMVLVSIACVSGEQCVLAEDAPESPAARLRREGIRAMSNGDPEKIAAAGFNVTLPWARPLRGAKKMTSPDSSTMLRSEDFSEESVEELRSWALKCRKHDIVMMYMMCVAEEYSVRLLAGLEGDLLNYIGFEGRDPLSARVKKIWPEHQYRHVVDWNGEEARWAPCPLERRYWMGFIRPQLELVARVLNETGATGGGALELETYCFYSIYPGMASQKKTFCYCDECFYGFVRSQQGTEVIDAVLPSARFDWLIQRGLLPAYENYLEKRMAEIIGEMMHEVRRVKPDFLFGVYPYAPFWYYDALIWGSGTPELPCLLFPSAEYYSGYTAEADPQRTFFGDAPTAAGVAHLRRRNFPALYAGGIYDFALDAMMAATDRLVRGADGYWIWMGGCPAEKHQSILRLHPVITRWTRDHPDPLPAGDLRVDVMAAATQWVRENRPEGVTVGEGRIETRYDGEAPEVRLVRAGSESADVAGKGWQGRGEVPPLDGSVCHSGGSSIRFEPSGERPSPTSPYIDQKVPDARKGQSYDLSFWVKTSAGGEPVRLWVGRADSSQWPAYMWYSNYFVPPNRDWMRLRTDVSYGGESPLVLRFWCPPTDGKLWLDDISLRPVQVCTIDVPLNPPADATGWGSVDWKLSPSDARCNARIVDAQDDHDLRITLYPGDSLAPLEAIIGRKPVVLRLEVYPSAAEPVILEKVQAGFTSSAGK